MEFPLNTIGVAHRFLSEHIRPGDFCIDATAGRGRDTAFLCRLVGESGHVIAFDIQEEALASTQTLLEAQGLSSRATLHLDSHSHMDAYAQPGTVDCVVFNFGYLPGGDHSISTRAETSIEAIEKGLALLRPGGAMSLCIYYGGDSGFEEKDALMEYLETVDSTSFTVIVSQFFNRPNHPPIPVFILKEG